MKDSVKEFRQRYKDFTYRFRRSIYLFITISGQPVKYHCYALIHNELCPVRHHQREKSYIVLPDYELFLIWHRVIDTTDKISRSWYSYVANYTL